MGEYPSTENVQIALKQHELENQSWQLFNNYSQDIRGRVDGLVKSVLIVSGSALTLSAGLFLRQDRPLIYPELIPVLKNAWAAFGIAIALMILLVLWMIAIASEHEARWARMLRRETSEIGRPKIWTSSIAWILGLLGLAAFFTGLASLIYVARGML